jgi:hypothetical protein
LRAKKILWTEKKYPITKKISGTQKKIEISDKAEQLGNYLVCPERIATNTTF